VPFYCMRFLYQTVWQHLSALGHSIYTVAVQQALFIQDSSQNSFWDSVVEYPYYMPSPTVVF
jgi:hypothetical protein